MDMFEQTTHAAMKGALAACLQGRWSNHPLSTEIRFADGTHRQFDLVLALGEHEGDPSVQLIIASRKDESRKLEEELADAVRRDPTTGLLYRMPLLAAVNERLAEPVRAGRALLRGASSRTNSPRSNVTWACSPAKMCCRPSPRSCAKACIRVRSSAAWAAPA